MKKLIKALAFAAGAALLFNFASCSGGEESGEVKKSNL